MQYGLAQAKARLSELTTLVDAGEDVVIAKHGRPSYRLVAVAAKNTSPTPSSSSTVEVDDMPPASLDDMTDFLVQLRGKTRMPPGSPGFVAEWRAGERY